MRISDGSSDVCSSDLLVEIAQQRATAGQHDAALGDVRAQFRRRAFEGLLDGLDDAGQWLLQCVEDLVGVHREVARHAGSQMAADDRSEEHKSELQSLMRISYDVFCLNKKNKHENHNKH